MRLAKTAESVGIEPIGAPALPRELNPGPVLHTGSALQVLDGVPRRRSCDLLLRGLLRPRWILLLEGRHGPILLSPFGGKLDSVHAPRRLSQQSVAREFVQARCDGPARRHRSRRQSRTKIYFHSFRSSRFPVTHKRKDLGSDSLARTCTRAVATRRS